MQLSQHEAQSSTGNHGNPAGAEEGCPAASMFLLHKAQIQPRITDNSRASVQAAQELLLVARAHMKHVWSCLPVLGGAQ